MKQLSIILIYLFLGCSSKNNDVENIEFISYNWSFENGKFFIKPEMYSCINKSGESKNISTEYFPKKEDIYFKSIVQKSIVDSILKIANNTSKHLIEIDYPEKNACIKEPPLLKIKINYSNGLSKQYKYNFQNTDKSLQTIKSLYMSLTIAKINGDLTTYNDTAFINQNRKLFITSSMNEDTLIRPLPAKPKKINSIKFWNKK